MQRYQLVHRDTGVPILDSAGEPKFVWSDEQPEDPQAGTKPWVWVISPEVPAEITVRQLAIGLLLAGKGADAVAIGNRTLPPGVQAIYDTLPEQQQQVVTLTIQLMATVQRRDPLIDLFAAGYGWGTSAVDDFFRQWVML